MVLLYFLFQIVKNLKSLIMNIEDIKELLEINYKVNKSIIDHLQSCCKDFSPNHGVEGTRVADHMNRAKRLLDLPD